MPDDASIVHAESAFACGRCGELVVLVWRGAPTRESSDRSVVAVTRAAEAAGRRIGLMSVIEAGSPPPPLAIFPSIARSFDALPALVATAAVLEDRGELAGRLLDAMSTVISLTRRKHALKACIDTDEAATWMAARLGTPAEDFRRVAAALAAQVRAAISSA